MARKTHTSNAVKDRWNAKNYDRLAFHVKKGGRELIRSLAADNGQTFAEYMRQLVLEDAKKRNRTDVIEFFGGGGITIQAIDYWRAMGLIDSSTDDMCLNEDGDLVPADDAGQLPLTLIAVERCSRHAADILLQQKYG